MRGNERSACRCAERDALVRTNRGHGHDERPCRPTSRVMADGELLELGVHMMRWFDTPYKPLGLRGWSHDGYANTHVFLR